MKKVIADSAARQEKVGQPEMLLSAKDLQILEYDDALTARIIEKITVRARNEIEIRFIGGYKKDHAAGIKNKEGIPQSEIRHLRLGMPFFTFIGKR